MHWHTQDSYAWLISDFMQNPPSPSLKARLSLKISMQLSCMMKCYEVTSKLSNTYLRRMSLTTSTPTFSKDRRYTSKLQKYQSQSTQRGYTKALCCGLEYKETRVRSILVKGLYESGCDNICVYSEQQLQVLLKGLASYANNFFRITNKNVRGSASLKNRPFRLSVGPNKTNAQAVMPRDADGQNYITDFRSKTWPRRYGDRCPSSSPPSTDSFTCF